MELLGADNYDQVKRDHLGCVAYTAQA
jgi:hypothetical protein